MKKVYMFLFLLVTAGILSFSNDSYALKGNLDILDPGGGGARPAPTILNQTAFDHPIIWAYNSLNMTIQGFHGERILKTVGNGVEYTDYYALTYTYLTNASNQTYYNNMAIYKLVIKGTVDFGVFVYLEFVSYDEFLYYAGSNSVYRYSSGKQFQDGGTSKFKNINVTISPSVNNDSILDWDGINLDVVGTQYKSINSSTVFKTMMPLAVGIYDLVKQQYISAAMNFTKFVNQYYNELFVDTSRVSKSIGLSRGDIIHFNSTANVHGESTSSALNFDFDLFMLYGENDPSKNSVAISAQLNDNLVNTAGFLTLNTTVSFQYTTGLYSDLKVHQFSKSVALYYTP